MIRILPLLLFIFTIKFSFAQKNKSSFYQKTQVDISLPSSVSKNVLRLFSVSGVPIAVTENAVLFYKNSRWLVKAIGDKSLAATLDTQQKLWLVSQKGIQNEEGRTIPLPPTKDSIRCLYWQSADMLYVGTNGGLYMWKGKWSPVAVMKGIAVNDMIADVQQRLWVATSDGLWRKENNKLINLDDVLMAEGHDRKYFALASDNNGKDIIFSSPLAVGCIAGDGEHWMLRATDGLPYGPVNRIIANKGKLWLGTNKGAILKDSAWHYYYGRRWLPSNHVNDILVHESGRVWIATAEGISEIREQKITLAQKANYYDSIIDLRHNRHGLINNSKLSVPGDLSTSYKQNEDNDGLWTSCYLAVQCFRYAVTQQADARNKAVRTFEALERLETVTGISGYPARSYAPITEKVTQSRSPHPKQWHVSNDGKWQWLDDTSSDEITGHLFTLSLFYELVADTSQKLRVKQLINRIVTHIVDNNFHLIDLDGKPTRWGIWHPDSLNHSPNWMYERSLNSLQMLSFLKTAIHYTGNPKFKKAYQELTEQHGYANNAVQAKIYGPFETSHSDDILNFFPYYGLLKYSGNDTNRALFIKSLERSWRNVRNDRMPVWNVISSALLQKDCGLAIALEELQQYPLDLVDWTMDNSHRWDLEKDPLVDRGRQQQATQPVPTAESGISRWNTNPKRLKVGQDGMIEETGTYFLFAYWMGRYYGFWTE